MLRARGRNGPLLPGGGYNQPRRPKHSLADNLKRVVFLSALAALLFLAALGWKAVSSSRAGSGGFKSAGQESQVAVEARGVAGGQGVAAEADGGVRDSPDARAKQAAQQAQQAQHEQLSQQGQRVQQGQQGSQQHEALQRAVEGLGRMSVDCGPEGCKEEPVKAHTADQAARAADSTAQQPRPPSPLYNITATDLDGLEHIFSEYRDKVLLVTNVASECGYTDVNYKGLQRLYERYHSQGFEILAFPCNQFLNQEPGDAATIKDFVRTKYHITFPVFQKTVVNGPDQHPVFAFVKSVMSVAGFDAASWNFAKYLVGRDGYPVKHYQADFNEAQLQADIETELRRPPIAAAAR